MERTTKKYADTASGAIALLWDELSDPFDRDAALGIADPQVKGCWLVIDDVNESAYVVYIDRHDFEEVDFNEAVERYVGR